MAARRTCASLALAAACALIPTAGRAEVQGLQLTLSPYAGVVWWSEAVELETDAPVGLRAGIMFGRYLGLEGAYDIAFTKAEQTPAFTSRAHHLGVDAVLNLLPGAPVVPYLVGGWAQLEFRPDPWPGLGWQTFNGWEGGLGLKTRLWERIALRVEARDVAIRRDDPAPRAGKFSNNIYVTGGLHFALGGKVPDSDGDGVADRKDRCSDTPTGAKVDATGCPIDSDGDGVPDGIDRCSDTAKGAKVDVAGCPIDGDGDGVPDGIDRCSDTAKGAKVDVKGCPIDSDSDGVPDGLDRCANSPSGARVDARGCPTDSDGDGVPDGIDQCANTPPDVRVDNIGCPIEVSEKETQLLDTGMIRLSDINFETAKWDIKPESFAILDEVGRILMQWPQLQIEIGGHTDSRGSDARNLELSQRRAQAVLDYLTSKFPQIDAKQYTAKGYGEGLPIADNKTQLGMAKNRRVEFKVLNREVLKKESERRKLLKKEGGD